MPATRRPTTTSRPASKDDALVERAIAFERATIAAAADRVVPVGLGEWHRNEAHPGMWTLNQLHVLGHRPELTADVLLAELDRGLGDAGHRRATVADDATGRRIAPGIAGRPGWEVLALLVMVLDREPPTPPPGVAREVGEATMRALDEQIVTADTEVPEGDRAIVLDGHAHMRASIPGTRAFVGASDGVDASNVTLFCDGRTGQPELVNTLPEHRGRGLAAATVSLATREAQATGCDLVFIVCEATRGPVALYAGLGFRAAGRYWSITRP